MTLPTDDDRARGLRFFAEGRFADAIDALRRALSRAPRDLELVSALAESLYRVGRLREAVARLRQRVELRPDVADFHHDLGQGLIRLGDEQAAIASLERAVDLAPHSSIVRVDLGNLHVRRGDLAAAETQFRAAMANDPLWAAPRAGLGTVLFARQRIDEAIELFREAITRDPGNVEIANALGGALLAARRVPEAVDCLQAASHAAPDHAATALNLGLALRLAGDLDQATRIHRRLVDTAPDRADAWDALAQDLGDADDLEGALAAARRAVKLAPKRAPFRAHLGNLLAQAGEMPGAIAAYREALRRQPDLAIARWNLALARLATGDYAQGWRDYEARWLCAEFPSPRRRFVEPPLTALADAPGRRVLVYAEQGLGDTLQFVRFVPQLAAHGAAVVVEVPRTLVRVLQDVEGIGTLVAQGDPLPPFDSHVAMLSLPLLLGAYEPDGSAVPYLRTSSEVRRRVASPPRVGVVWSGGSHHVNDRRRSLTLQLIGSWFERTDIEWVGLQKEMRKTDEKSFEALSARHPFLPDGTRLDDFADTAALIATLDLVIAVDTSVAHLAGAMGRPVWILLANVPDFRWSQHGVTTRWYPSARLFRCSVDGGWNGVVAEVARALDERFLPD